MYILNNLYLKSLRSYFGRLSSTAICFRYLQGLLIDFMDLNTKETL